jgi:thioredoxin 2
MEHSIAACVRCGTKNRISSSSRSQVPVCGKCGNPLPWIVSGTDSSFQEEISSFLPVLVDFWAEWCAPCRATAPVLDGLAGDKAGRIKIVKVNVDQNPATAGRYNIRSIPTMILFKNGNIVDTLVGAMSKDALLQRIGPHLG